MSVEALYPFLYGGGPPVDDDLEEIIRVTRKKIEDVAELRASASDREAIERCAAAIAPRLLRGGCLYVFGNGGSATDAAAIAHLFLQPHRGRPFAAVSLPSDIATVTAIANDVGFEAVFARQLSALARPDDIAMAISTSGNSPNLLRALQQARTLRLLTVGLSGGNGGRMAEEDLADHLLVAASDSVHRIQEVQTTLYHLLWEAVQAATA